MLSRLYNIGIAALLMSAMSLMSCQTDDIEVPDPMQQPDPVLQIQISRNGFAATRASGAEFTKAEKKVVSVDLFFYADDATDASTPLYYVRAVPTMNTELDKSNTGTLNVSVPANDVFGETRSTCRVYAAVNTDITKNAKTLTRGELLALKATSSWFATGLLPDEDAENLNNFSGFVMFTSAAAGDVVTYDRAERKVEGTVIVSKSTAKIDLMLGFPRGLADGEPIECPDPNDPTGPSLQWKVYTADDAMEAFIVNGVQAIRLGGYNGTEFLEEADYFDYRMEEMRRYARGFKDNTDEGSVERYPYMLEAPFYTYPNEWTTDIVEQHRTSIVLKVNWLPEGGDATTDLVETYYSVPLCVEDYIDKGYENKIVANRYYRVKVLINTLGGQHFGQPLQLDECSYEVLPWGSAELDAVLRDTRYLQIPQQVKDRDGEIYTAIMNNTDLVTIPLNSSHKVRLRDVKISYTDFTDPITYVASHSTGGSDQSTVYQYPGATRSNDVGNSFTISSDDLANPDYQGIYIDDIAQTLTMRHDVGLMYSSDGHYLVDKNVLYQYSPYIITITLDHADNLLARTETITIKQYPAIYIEAEINASINSVNFIAGSGRDVNFDRYVRGLQQHFYGFARVNGNGRDNDASWGGLEGIAKAGRSTGTTSNPIMYTINATQLGGEWTQYHIADPRNNYSNTDLSGDVLIDDGPKVGSGWTGARHIDNEANTSYQLTWYYPTKEDLTDNARWAISPRFRVASSFGSFYNPTIGNNAQSRTNARKRCAAYTEYGLPAGRWRLPTLGEFQSIKYMSDKGVIPQLFNDKVVYFTAQGPYYIDGNTIKEASGNMSGVTGTATTGFVRCVYDDWYWVKADGSPDRLPISVNTTANEYNFERLYNGGNIFIWGDRERKSPQDQNQN